MERQAGINLVAVIAVDQVLELARLFRGRLIALVVNWMRVGYCQGNFNSDNCAAGGFTLDYGPFGFCELFDPRFQPWTGGGEHFCFFNQAQAAEANYRMFWSALRELLTGNSDALAQLDQLKDSFADTMKQQLELMWASKIGLNSDQQVLVQELLQLMVTSRADFTKLFRQLSNIPDHVSALKSSFYLPSSDELDGQWSSWLLRWREALGTVGELNEAAAAMQRLNPAITWREWLIAPAYQQASLGDSGLIDELQRLFSDPYNAPSEHLAGKYDQLKPRNWFNAGGVSHYSCSS